jgi:signal transduction histidine kinase
MGNRIALLDPTRDHPLRHVFGEREEWSSRINITALFEDSRGNIFAACLNRGVEFLDADSIVNGSFHHLSIPHMASNEKVASILQDHTGNVWIASETSGLTVLEKRSLMGRPIRAGLPSNIVRSVTEDTNGKLWVSTNLGIISLDSSRSMVVHRKHDLIGSSVYSSGLTKNGLLWFVTSDGLLTYEPSDEPVEKMPPPTVITRFQVNDRERAINSGMKLSYDENRCVIDFIGVSFRDEQSIRYEHRLIGVDKDWQPPTRNPSVTYAALEPGTYSFEVRASTASGGPSGKSTMLEFSVVPPFWKTWWFFTIAWLSIAGAGAGALRYVEITRLHRKMRVLEQQKALEQERLRISSDLHDELASNLTSIAMLSKMLQGDEQSGQTMVPVKSRLLERITTLSKESVDGIRDIIWAIDPKAETLGSLLERIRDLAVVYCRARDVRFTYVNSGIDAYAPENLPPDVRRHLWLLLKEATNNALKHSGCRTISLVTSSQDGCLSITLTDDGCGFDPLVLSQGKGLGTMRSRAEEIGSRLNIITQPGRGTSVTVVLNGQNSMNRLL